MRSTLISVGLICVMLPCTAQNPGVWTSRSPIPMGRGFTSGAIVDGKIYIIGGFPDHQSVTASVECYDPARDAWTEMQPMPEARCSQAVCAYKDRIYVFGGIRSNGYGQAGNNVYVYDVKNNSWATVQDMPYEIAFSGIAVVADTIYLLGGTRQIFEPPVSRVMAYQPETDTWSEKAPLPVARAFLSACTIDHKIYTFGGGDEQLVSHAYKDVLMYDPRMNRWERKNDMEVSRMAAGVCNVDGKFYLTGGITDGLSVVNSNDLFDPNTDTWISKSPMREFRQSFFLGVIADKMYAIGGSYPNPQNRSEPLIPVRVEVYDYLSD